MRSLQGRLIGSAPWSNYLAVTHLNEKRRIGLQAVGHSQNPFRPSRGCFCSCAMWRVLAAQLGVAAGSVSFLTLGGGDTES